MRLQRGSPRKMALQWHSSFSSHFKDPHHGRILHQLWRSAFWPVLRTLRSSRSISFCASDSRCSDSSARRRTDSTTQHDSTARPANVDTSTTATNFYTAADLTAIRRTATCPACVATTDYAAAKIFRRRQSSADHRWNCSGSRSRSVWRGALWRALGQAQSIFYYRRCYWWRIVWL